MSGELHVDEDLTAMMRDVLAAHSAPGAETDPTEVWASLSEVGLARLTAPENSGGSGAGWAEAATLLRLCAAAGVAVPYAETDLVVGPLRRAAGLDDTSLETATLAVVAGDGLARRVSWAGATDTILLLRRRGGPGASRYEVSEIPTGSAVVEPVAGVSSVPLGDVAFAEGRTWVPVDVDVAQAAVLRGALARAVQCVGAAEAMLDAAVTHSVERRQFGRSLARFQSVQNLVVDIAAETVLARAAVDTALADAATTDLAGPVSGFRVAVARSVVSQALSVTVRNTHQVHGAIGTTLEHPLHRVTLPALQWRGEFGSAGFWEEALAAAAIPGGRGGAWSVIVDGVAVDAASEWLARVTR